MTIQDEVMNEQNRLFRATVRTAAMSMLFAGAVMSACAQSLSVAPTSSHSQNATMLAAAESPAAFSGIANSAPMALPGVGVSSSVSTSSSALPDAPSAVMFAAVPVVDTKDKRAVDSSPTAPFASRFTKYIPADERGVKISGRDKVVIGLKDTVSPFSFLGILVTAGYSHVTNGEPNYGTDRGAFGERLGATAIRDTSETIFSDAVMSPILHEDPRYYVEGDQFSFIHRTIYAVTRPLITRTDSGHASVNGAILIGYAFASALSYAYYPKSNQNFHDTASTYGGSLGGAALGDFVSEFADGFLQAVHLEKKH
jgi:hypothetical protein